METPRAVELALRVVAAAGLLVDAYVHFDLAAGYDRNAAVISQGVLFRVEGALAVVAALLVLFLRSRIAALVAFLVGAGGVVLVVIYRYVNIGVLGPLPNMYEPSWYPEKTLSTVGEALTAVASLFLLLVYRRKRDSGVATG